MLCIMWNPNSSNRGIPPRAYAISNDFNRTPRSIQYPPKRTGSAAVAGDAARGPAVAVGGAFAGSVADSGGVAQ